MERESDDVSNEEIVTSTDPTSKNATEDNRLSVECENSSEVIENDWGLLESDHFDNNQCLEDEDDFRSGSPSRRHSLIPEGQASPSSIISCDLDRPSPLDGSPCMDCSDDAGSDDPSAGQIGTASDITSTWVRSGGECYRTAELDYFGESSRSEYQGLGYHGDEDSALQSSKSGSTAPAFEGPVLMSGTRCDLKEMETEGLDKGLFGVNPPCTLGEFVDVGGPAPSKETNEKYELIGPVQGPSLQWPAYDGDDSTVDNKSRDVKGHNNVAGECGLQNLGNTCFMAAGLQCLFNTPPIAKYYLNAQISEEKSRLLSAFSELISKIWSGQFSSVRPTDFKYAFGLQWPDFSDFRQHDCQEFVTLLLEGLRKQMTAKRESPSDHVKTEMDRQLSSSPKSCDQEGWNNTSVNDKSSDVDLPSTSHTDDYCMKVDSDQSVLNGSIDEICLLTPASPPSPRIVVRSDEHIRALVESQDDIGEDSGPTSPKSSVSSSSVDSHHTNLRLQPIPEEVLLQASAFPRDVSVPDTENLQNSATRGEESLQPSKILSNQQSSVVVEYDDDTSRGMLDDDRVNSDGADTSPQSPNMNTSCGIGDNETVETVYTDSSYPSTDDRVVNDIFDTSNADEQDTSKSFTLQNVSCSPNFQRVVSNSESQISDSDARSGSAGAMLLDIAKESKTSNINFLQNEVTQNNQFILDSEKFHGKSDKLKLDASILNFESSSDVKRNELTNVYRKNKNDLSNDEGSCTRMKRNSNLSSCDVDQACSCSVMPCKDNVCSNANFKKIRLDEKNLQHELERSQRQLFAFKSDRARVCGHDLSVSSDKSTNGSFENSSDNSVANRLEESGCVINSQDEEGLSANDNWKTFVGESADTVLMDTFFGQYKSCLVCNTCGHSSVKFDPFSTLSVPLPHASETQIVVTYVAGDGAPALKCLITLCKISYVKDLKEALVKLLTQDYLRHLTAANPQGSKAPKNTERLPNKAFSASDSDAEMYSLDEQMMIGCISSSESKFQSLASSPDSCSDVSDESVHSSQEPTLTSKFASNENAMDDDQLCRVSVSKNKYQGKRKRTAIRKPPKIDQLVVSEVFDNHIAKILDDSYHTKYVNQTTRSVYAYHLLPYASSEIKTSEDALGQSTSSSTSEATSHCTVARSDENLPAYRDQFFSLSGGSNSRRSVSPLGHNPYSYGGIDGGNASCSYTAPDSSMRPLSGDQMQNISTGEGNPSGGVHGGAASITLPNLSSSASTLSTLELPVSTSQDSVSSKQDSSDANKIVVDQNEWKSCNICLEEMCLTELKSHGLCYDCLLCDSCIEMSCKHHGGETLPCPVCQITLTRASLIPVARRQTVKPKPRQLRVSVVFRLDTDSQDNNKRHSCLLGHPRIVNLPARLPMCALHAALQSLLPPAVPYMLLLVDGRGYNCSRCLFSSHCRGCEVGSVGRNQKDSSESFIKNVNEPGTADENETIINLLPSDTLCVRFTKLTALQRNFLTLTREHESLAMRRQDRPLSLYDCLKAFTKSETLESGESWYCPQCECKQSATKTVSVWRCPPFLIVHLERFLFHGAISSKVDDKVIFPLENLDMSEYLGGRQIGPLFYNLYGVVCHMGVAQAGHYTALVRSPASGQWRYFNDEFVSAKKPCEDEYSSAYLLFYHRSCNRFHLELPLMFNFRSDDEQASSELYSRKKFTSPVIDITGDDDPMELDSIVTISPPACASYANELPDLERPTPKFFSSPELESGPPTRTPRRALFRDEVSSTSDGNNPSNLISSEEPMEGTVIDSFMEASLPVEGSSVSRSSTLPSNDQSPRVGIGLVSKSYCGARDKQNRVRLSKPASDDEDTGYRAKKFSPLSKSD